MSETAVKQAPNHALLPGWRGWATAASLTLLCALLLAWTGWSLHRGLQEAPPFSGILSNLENVLSLSTALLYTAIAFFAAAVLTAHRVCRPRLGRDLASRLASASWRGRRFSIPGAPLFMLFYLKAVFLMTYFAGSTFQPRSAYPEPHAFWHFWHGAEAGAPPLLSFTMWINVLAVVYLWLDFRSYRASVRQLGLGLYAVYAACLLLLLTVHVHYFRISEIAPHPLLPVQLGP